MTTQPAKWPPRINTVENGTKENEGVFISWEEHAALIAEARAECWRDAAIDSEELASHMVNDTDKELVLEQKGYFECVAAQYSEARPQSSEPERKA